MVLDRALLDAESLRYLVIWFSFYALKVALTALVVILCGEEFHLWFGVFYFLVFSTIRSTLVWQRRRDGIARASRETTQTRPATTDR